MDQKAKRLYGQPPDDEGEWMRNHNTHGQEDILNYPEFDEDAFRSEFRKGWAEGSVAARRVAEKIGGKLPVKSPEHVSAGQSISDEDAESIAEDLAVAMAKLTYGQSERKQK